MSWVVESKLCSKKCPSDPVLQGSWCRVGWSEIHRVLLELKGKDKKKREKVVLISKNVNFTSIGIHNCCSSVGWDKKTTKSQKSLQAYYCFLQSGGTALCPPFELLQVFKLYSAISNCCIFLFHLRLPRKPWFSVP